MKPLTADLLQRLVNGTGRADIIAALVAGLPASASTHNLDTAIRTATFLSHAATETGGFMHLEENLRYSAARLTKVWPSRFPSIAAAAPYAMNPEKLANRVYGGRLGNVNQGDGWTYRGRGMFQTTGRENYRRAGFEASPDDLAKAGPAFAAAIQFWRDRNIAELADRDDIVASTKAINGGLNGLSERKIYLNRAKRLMGI